MPPRCFFCVLLHGFPACNSFFSLDKVGAFCYSEGKEIIEDYNDRLPQAPITTFEMLKIDIGQELTFTRDEKIVCKVYDNRKVEYKGKIYSLSNLTREILISKYHGRSKHVNGFQYWKYEDEILVDRRERLESEEEKAE